MYKRASCLGRIVQGANCPGGELSRGRIVQLPTGEIYSKSVNTLVKSFVKLVAPKEAERRAEERSLKSARHRILSA